MLNRLMGMAGMLGLCLLVAEPTSARSPPSEQMVGARKLVVTMKLASHAQELREITTFYRTPTGQTLLEQLAAITQQSITLGQAWGAKSAKTSSSARSMPCARKGYNVRIL
jgi:hypothetical protein